MDVEIIDTTLRDGEQAPGISFSRPQKISIVESLIDMGVDEIEAGIPIMGKPECDFVKSLSRFADKIRISAWSRFKLSDVMKVYETGVDTVHISVPVSGYHLPNQLGSWGNVLEKFEEILDYSTSRFRNVSIGVQDSFRSDETRILDLCRIAEENSLFRIRFSDTVGTATPAAVKEFIEKYRPLFSGRIDFHGHNDLGLAAANSLVALEAGANSVNVTVNGIGERAGNCALEQIAFIIDLHHNLESGMDVKRVKPLCEQVADYTRREIAPDKPIIGSNVFTHESGIHCHGMLKNPLAYQPFCPEEKGLDSSRLVVGKHSGRSSVKDILNKAGIVIEGEELSGIMHKFKELATKKRNYLTSDEVITIYNTEHLGGVL